MVAAKSSRVNRQYKKKYRIRNWREYERGLRSRGDVNRQQARVENSFFRYKSVLGGGLKARHGKAQRREVAIGCHILNRMTELGRPKSCAVVS